ncbi:MAG: Nramp family divalent metal transporter, partial [Brachybacterium tyrofermentans]
AAFFILGAAVLHPQGLVPEGNEMILTLSETFSGVFGEVGRIVFLLGALAALGSTIWAAIPSWSRSWANALSIVGVFDWADARKRTFWMRVFIAFLPAMWLLTFLWINEPLLMIMVGGIAGGIFLAAVAISALYLRGRIEPALRGGRFIYIALIISSLAIIALGIYSAVTTVIG